MKVLRAERVASAVGPQDFPREQLPEVALLGRSNVGKSTLLNRLCGRRQLARTSRTPGKTRLLHFYRIERDRRALLLVDLPGYGFAKVSKRERRRWRSLVEGYLEGRAPLRVALLLQDLRRDVGDDEHELLAWLAERQLPVVVVVTKIDKLKPMRRAERLEVLRAQLGLPADRVVATSAQQGWGVRELWQVLERWL